MFLSAIVSKGYHVDSPQFENLMKRLDSSIEIGDACGDPAYLSRANVQIVADEDGQAIIKLKSGITLKAKGYPAWPKLIKIARENPKEYDKRYHRRSVIGGLLQRFQDKIRI